MDGIALIQQRIGQIHNLIASVSPTSATQETTGASGLTGTLASSTGLFSSDTSFASILSQLQGTDSTLAAAATQLNSSGVPLTLAGYGNGRIPESALGTINGSSERLWAPAATQLNALLADAKASGVSIGVTDGYRSYESQVGLVQSKGLYSQGGLAAEPGTSKHGWGMAVDLGLDATAQAWMRQHAKEYGFVETLDREPWHWEFKPQS